MFNKSILSLLFISSLFFIGCQDDKQEEKKVQEKVKQKISKNLYSLKALDGSVYRVKKVADGFTVEGYEDKIIIFDIYATWCPPCQMAATHLSSLQEKYMQDVLIIGITIEDLISNEKLFDFKTTYNANYILVNSSENNRLNKALALAVDAGKRHPIPFLLIYKDSKLIEHYFRAVQEEFIESDIKRALGK